MTRIYRTALGLGMRLFHRGRAGSLDRLHRAFRDGRHRSRGRVRGWVAIGGGRGYSRALLPMNISFPSVLAAVADLPLLAQAATSTVFSAEGRKASLWEVLSAGGWVMIPLGILSVLTIALAFAFALTLRRRSVVTTQYLETAEGLLKKGDALGLLAVSNRHGEAVARVVQRTLEFQARHPEADARVLREVAETEGSAQASSIQNSVIWLADIGVLAPMLGLLGTVTGIIRSFASLGKVTLSPARDAMLASGVSEALVATAAGLILGVSAFALYALFRNRAQRLISELEGASAHLIGVMSTARVASRAGSMPNIHS